MSERHRIVGKIKRLYEVFVISYEARQKKTVVLEKKSVWIEG